MTRTLSVAIIGAGMSGLFLGYHLDRAGIEFEIFEKRADVGGTWYDNTYPGLHVDVITRSYEFPFARSTSWSRRYAPGSEVRQYLSRFATDENLRSRIRFECEVLDATYDGGRWNLTLSDGTTRQVDVVVAATGFLRVPTVPNLPGAASFSGKAFHSSQWPADWSAVGKKVAVVGAGSSGVQIVSALGKQGVDVTHYIRTPQWMITKPNPEISRTEKLLLKVPVLARYWDWRMRRLRLQTDGSENWKLQPGPEREQMARRLLQDLETIKDPVLRKNLTPTEPPGCKRIPKTPDYYQVVQRPNVHCVFGPITRIEEAGIVDADGTLRAADVIVYATGFDAHAYLRPMTVTGAGGQTLQELWSDGLFSYRGVALPGMPNFFLLNGPFAPVNSVAVPTCLRDEVGYLLKIFDVLRDGDHALAPTVEASNRFRDHIYAALPNTTFSLCDNWYTDQAGTAIIWPFTREAHREQYTTLDLADFESFPLGDRLERIPSP